MISGVFCVGEKLILLTFGLSIAQLFRKRALKTVLGNHGLFVMSQRAHPHPPQVSDRPHPELGLGSALGLVCFFLLPKRGRSNEVPDAAQTARGCKQGKLP